MSVLSQVVEQPTTLADQQQQTTTAVVVVLVLLEVLGEVDDAVAQQRDLHLGRTGVTLGGGVLGDDLLLGLASVRSTWVSSSPGFVARRARACSPGHSGSAADLTAVVEITSGGTGVLIGDPRLGPRRVWSGPRRGTRVLATRVPGVTRDADVRVRLRGPRSLDAHHADGIRDGHRPLSFLRRAGPSPLHGTGPRARRRRRTSPHRGDHTVRPRTGCGPVPDRCASDADPAPPHRRPSDGPPPHTMT